MNRTLAIAAALALLCLGVTAQADVFDLGFGLTNLETVTVGDPGNAGELSGGGAGGYGADRVCGLVSYAYSIGKYEVTAGQYTEFLNAVARTDTYGLYSPAMSNSTVYGCMIQRSGVAGSYIYSVAADWANRPVNYVSFWDACRFANWLHNGQPVGLQNNSTTEEGAYVLGGYTSADGRNIQRKGGWRWAVTSEDEWYKAAYYKGGGTNVGYWDYPTRSDSTPTNDVMSPDGGNNADFYQDGYAIGSPYYRTEAGEFENSESAYGTFDQGGNVSEWTEAIVRFGTDRGMRGGSYSGYATELQAAYRDASSPSYEHSRIGFRVVQAVPEPSSLIALTVGLVSLAGLRRRRT